MSTDGAGRPYRSALREEQAEQTRLRIARAARDRFVERGWAGTSVRSVAVAAGGVALAVAGCEVGLAASPSMPSRVKVARKSAGSDGIRKGGSCSGQVPSRRLNPLT